MEFFAWIFFLALIVIMYRPLFKQLYKRWKNRKQSRQAPLLGVVYPPTKKDKKDI